MAPVRIRCGTAAERVRHRCETGAEPVRIACGMGAERVRNGCGRTPAERQRNAGGTGAERRRNAGGTPADLRRGVLWCGWCGVLACLWRFQGAHSPWFLRGLDMSPPGPSPRRPLPLPEKSWVRGAGPCVRCAFPPSSSSSRRCTGGRRPAAHHPPLACTATEVPLGLAKRVNNSPLLPKIHKTELRMSALCALACSRATSTADCRHCHLLLTSSPRLSSA